jgi:GT2 family glycosyltransferase
MSSERDPAGDGSPRLTVAVVSNRPLRLRWLLNALEAQTLPRDQWEMVVLDDSSGPDTGRLLQEHPLALAGVVRRIEAPKPGGVGAKRNATWRASRGATVVFTDDDCRPPPEWLERLALATEPHDEAVVQGATRPDPHELPLLEAAPWARTQHIEPPVVWAQTCNIAYPRALLERLGGFHEGFPFAAGEDTDLAARARRAGAAYVAAPEALTYHAVDPSSLIGRIRSSWRWQSVPYAVKRNPELRAHLPLWIFWKHAHAWLPWAVAGTLLSRRNPLYLSLAIPWALHAVPSHGSLPRGRYRSLLEVPGRAAIDLAEFAACAWGSLRYRTLLL